MTYYYTDTVWLSKGQNGHADGLLKMLVGPEEILYNV